MKNMLTCSQKQQVGWPGKEKPVRDAIPILALIFFLNKGLKQYLQLSYCSHKP